MAARGLRTTVPVATWSRLCSYGGRTNAPNPATIPGTDIIDGTRLPRCPTGLPICLMCTPSSDRCRASNAEVQPDRYVGKAGPLRRAEVVLGDRARVILLAFAAAVDRGHGQARDLGDLRPVDLRGVDQPAVDRRREGLLERKQRRRVLRIGQDQPDAADVAARIVGEQQAVRRMRVVGVGLAPIGAQRIGRRWRRGELLAEGGAKAEELRNRPRGL